LPVEARTGYRPEIDGLRGIAVLAVVFFHADMGIQQGYLGVDVFFVISGFLITSLIWKDLQHDRFTLVSFWERRARRIIPATLVVTAATLVAGWVLLFPDDFSVLGRSVLAQSLFAGNIYFWRHFDYFAGPANQQPFLHMWSLAVEEQFYLAMPLLLLVVCRFARFKDRAVVCALLAVACLSSLAWSVHVSGRDQGAAFYLLPTRAWELLLGSTLALLPQRSSAGRPAVSEFTAVLGLGLILLPLIAIDNSRWGRLNRLVDLYHRATLHPRLAALAPCVGTALVIWATGQSRVRVGAWLANRLLVFVGLVSYSLYLWHWPIFAFSNYWALAPSSPGHQLVLIACAFVLSVLSWWFVETPFRQRRWCVSRRSILTLAGVGLVTVFMAGTAITLLKGFPRRFPPKVAADYQIAKHDFAFRSELTTEDILAGKLTVLGNPGPTAPVKMLVWGDSHAMSALPAFDAFLSERGLAGRAATRSQTAPLLGFFVMDGYGMEGGAIAFGEAVLSYVRNLHIPDVVLIASWGGYTNGYVQVTGGTASGDPRFARLDAEETALLSTVARLVGAGARPWIVLDVPTHTFDVPKAIARAALFHEDLDDLRAGPTSTNGLFPNDGTLLARVVGLGGRILDPRPRFLDVTGRHYVISANGAAIYVDSNHLTTTGAKLMLLPLLREAFAGLSAR
jgi:peptidoglycan/LPS O-acetylase OafA/YrhL